MEEKTKDGTYGTAYHRARYHARKKIKDQVRQERDSLDKAIDMVQRYWTLSVVRALAAGPMRYSALELMLGAPTESLRTAIVRMLDNGLIVYTRYNEVPPRVEYALTERGRGLLSVLAALEEWANE